MKPNTFLHGIALANFRGISNEIQYIAPFSEFNFFIGPNNAGKSSVLSFIAEYLNPFVCGGRRADQNLKALDRRIGGGEVIMGIGAYQHQMRTAVIEKYPNLQSRPDHLELLDKLLDLMSIHGFIWVKRKGEQYELIGSDLRHENLKHVATFNVWQSIWNIITRQSGGSLEAHWIPQTMEAIVRQLDISLPKISLIPAIRQISPQGEEFKDWSGKGLIEELARLQNPGFHERERLELFERINSFIRTVTENRSARIEIPHSREHVLVHIDGKVLPLESLGTGIHEVVMLASFCTLIESQIVCIEEPEIHLHPLLQRRLMQYLQGNTSNQYFIATHSPSLIDLPDSAVFHVTNAGGMTKID